MNSELRIANCERPHSQFTIHYSQLIILLFCWLLAACADENVAPTPLALIPTDVLQTTPTLAPGLPTAPPSPTTGPSPTFTPSPTPTATPFPATRIALGRDALDNGNLDAAAGQFEASLTKPEALTDPQQIETLLNLGQTYFQDGRFTAAATTFTQLLTTDNPPNETQFLLAQALEATTDFQGAIAAHKSYLEANPEMAAYVQPRIAAAYLALGEREAAIASYEAALSGPAHRLTHSAIRRALADLYLEDGNYEAAIGQYDEIRETAVTEHTRGEMTYLAGTAALMAGDAEIGRQYYLTGVSAYPRAYESYLGLVALVEAGIPVDAFQRGLVDFYAGAYNPAIAAFQQYIEANPGAYRADAHLYLAWSYEAMGSPEAALAQLDAYAALEPADAVIEQAKLYARADQTETAVAAYLSYLENFPDGRDAPFAAWWAAELTERLGDVATAVVLYQSLANNYAWHEDAPEALFRAGLLANGAGDVETAVNLWQQAVKLYPEHAYAAASLVWLLRTMPAHTMPFALTATAVPTPTVTATPVITGTTTISDSIENTLLTRAEIEALAASQSGVSYYPLRAGDVVQGAPPFPPVPNLNLPDADDGRSEAETWLRDWLALELAADIATLSPTLTEDPRFIIGQKLWQAGLPEEAKRELESLRAAVADDALLSYQLALFFRDLGLYRSSILAAASVLELSGQTVFNAPPFIGRLAYPVYYADLILPLAEQYSYDPLLQFSLVRQESLFESFARSGAAAQGLAQVIPDTGAYIAQRLAWPDYENDDLFKPFVGLAFGGYYLDQQLRAFDGFVAAALSAYNAGPGNAAFWYEQAGDDHDLYLETVNFAETRLYIERIYTGYVIYRFLYGGS